MKPKHLIAASLALPLLVLSMTPAATQGAGSAQCRAIEARMNVRDTPRPARTDLRQRLARMEQRAYAQGCDPHGGMHGYDACRGQLQAISALRRQVASGRAEPRPRRDMRGLRKAWQVAGCDRPAGSVMAHGEDPKSMDVEVRDTDKVVRFGQVVDAELADIPVPMPRPARPGETGYVAEASKVVETPGAHVVGETRPMPNEPVRVVGWQFLPDVDESQKFERIAKADDSFAGGVINQVVALFGVGVASAASVAETPPAPVDAEVERMAVAE